MKLCIVCGDDYDIPQKNSGYERHLFRAMKQSQNETIDQFITGLDKQQNSVTRKIKLMRTLGISHREM